jgi:histidyl-tRNA synthetase
MYRRERPAKGRYRQFFQAGVEVFGDAGPVSDAEIIALSVHVLRELQVSNVEVLVNSLGSREGRVEYREALRKYLEPFRSQLCGDCQRRIDSNPLRVLDCKVPSDAKIAQGAPTLLDSANVEDRAHFDQVCKLLDKLEIKYRIEPRLVRGLDYYTRTLFEVRDLSGELGAQSALLGGGRYDHMVSDLGGPAQPAIGFAMGIERILSSMPAEEAAERRGYFIACVQNDLSGEALQLAQQLRSQGAPVETDLRGGNLKKQLGRADKLNARYVVILGPDEIAKGVVQLKDLQKQSQEEVTREALIAHLRSS